MYNSLFYFYVKMFLKKKKKNLSFETVLMKDSKNFLIKFFFKNVRLNGEIFFRYGQN